MFNFRKAVLTFFAVLLVLLSLTGCGSQPPAPKSDKLDISLDVQPIYTGDDNHGSLQCNITTTNLPDKTELKVILQDQYGANPIATSVTVTDNKATAMYSIVAPGYYKTTIDTVDNEPASVKDVIGYKGEKLGGEYVVESNENYKTSYKIDYKNVILVGTEEQAKAVEARVKHNAEVALADLQKRQEQNKAQTQTTDDQHKPQKIVDPNGKQIWKTYISRGALHVTGNYKGTGNFIIKLSDSNQDLVTLICNEIGDYVLDKTVPVNGVGWYYLEVDTTDGSSSYQWS